VAISLRKRLGLALCGLLVCLGLVFFGIRTPGVASVGTACTNGDVHVVFARGSGAPVGGDMYNSFRSQIDMRIDLNKVKVTYYELGTGTGTDSLPEYPAYPVSGWSGWKIGLGAQVSNGHGFKYGESVDKGVAELKQHLLAVSQRCPHTKFILGGYSQGAQVIGEALPDVYGRSAENIVFIALFGDPKLHLPEGRGIMPPACKGKDLSDWRRTVPNCHTDDGTLGARKPYIPSSFHGRVGLWCNDKDWICGSSKNALNNSGHETYNASGGAIDKAAFEATRRLKEALPVYKAHAVNGSLFVRNVKSDTSKLDVMYVVGANASDNITYHAVLDGVRDQARDVWSVGGRVGIVSYYNVSWGRYATRPNQPMGPMPYGSSRGLINEEDQEQFWRKLAYIPDAYPVIGAYPIFYPAIFAVDDPPWQLGAQKTLVIISEDATYTQYGRYLLASRNEYVSYPDYLIQRSIEIDPVSVYFIVGNEENIDDANYIANGTAGKVFTYDPLDPTAVRRTIATVQQELTERPVVVFSQDMYHTDSHLSVAFDVSQSFSVDSEITQYDWDYEGDGVWDATTTSPHIEHTYPDGFSGSIIHVRATDSNGRIGSMTAEVDVYEPPQEQTIPRATGVAYEVLEMSNGISTVRLTWDLIDLSIPYLILSINGVHLGRIDRDRTTIDITEIHRNKATTIDLQLMTADYDMGDRSGVIVPAIRPSPKDTPQSSPLAVDYIDGRPINVRTSDSAPLSTEEVSGSLSMPDEEAHDGTSTDQRDLPLRWGGIVAVVIILIGCAWVVFRVRGRQG